MDIGLGLPNAVPNVTSERLLEWARRGDRLGFSSLATTDRLVYSGYDSLTTLAAAAAVTSNSRLMSAILIAPLRTNTALLAKETATIDRLSHGRLTLGLAVGMRRDDFAASAVCPEGRGARTNLQIEELRAIWSGERRGFAGAIGPAPAQPDGPELILGGQSPQALARAARYGQGWIAGSGGPGMFAKGAEQLRSTWRKAGRSGDPRMLALCYFALGDGAEELASGYLNDYYGFAPPYAAQVVRGAAVGDERLTATIDAYRRAGCDELLFIPCSDDLEQLERLAHQVRAANQTASAATAGGSS